MEAEKKFMNVDFKLDLKGDLLGRKEKSYFMNNHLNFKVMYHEDLETGTARVVGFEVIPLSINHGYKKWDEQNTKLTTCKPGKPTVFRTNSVPQEIVADNKVVFTYDVSFEVHCFLINTFLVLPLDIQLATWRCLQAT
ncbi:transmembrane 9 superfamily member 7-like [Nicotiana sylvestris]|uniref:transmembrane 9 superfamily member 7-like n=1 Tax=Nicotiana sylvestris TaxID=4096 RepID=UPI00388C3D4C